MSLDKERLNKDEQILNSYVFILSYGSSIERKLNREIIEVIRRQVEKVDRHIRIDGTEQSFSTLPCVRML